MDQNQGNQPMNDADIAEKAQGCRRVFDGRIIHIDHLEVELPDGRRALREVARHIGASAVVPIDAAGDVYLVRQYRAPIGRVLLEIPAGKLDRPDEDRLLAAQRELREEVGLVAGNYWHLTDIVTSPGFCDERISIYLATDLTPGEVHPDEDEFLHQVKLPFREALRMAQSGEISDAKTLVGLLLAAGRL